LPGETLEIRDGDVFINGQIAVKPLTVQKVMRIPVLHGRWEIQPGQLPTTYDFVWQPIRNVPHYETFLATEYDTMPDDPLYGVTNQLCENQWRIEQLGGIFPVRDLMLEFEWRPETAYRSLDVMASSGEHCCWVQFDSERKSVTVTPGNTQQQYNFHRETNGLHKITVSLFDRNLLVAVNDVIIVELPFENLTFDDEARLTVNVAPFALNFSDIGFSQEEGQAAVERQITNLRVWRDVYFTPQPGNASTTTVTVPAGCYYLLGDNNNFSADSRCWNEPFVTHRHLVGIVARTQRQHRQDDPGVF